MKPVIVILLLAVAASQARDLRHEDGEEHEHPHSDPDIAIEDNVSNIEDVEDRIATTLRSVPDEEENEEPEEFGIFKHHNEEHDEMLEEEAEEMTKEEENDDEEDDDDFSKKWDQWNEENKYKLLTEKCLISLAKACDLKRFCYDAEKDLTPVVVGKQKIKGGSCPKVDEDINSYTLAEPRDYDKCKSKNCSYCDEEKSEDPVDVCFLCYGEDGIIVDQKEVSANIVCEESYWKRFKKSYYDSYHGKNRKHHGGNKKVREERYHHWDKCNKDKSYNPYAIKMTVSSCQSTCEIKE